MKQTKTMNVIIRCLLIVILYLLSMPGIKTLIYALGVPRPHTNLQFMLYELIKLSLAFLAVFLCKQQHILQCKTKGLLKGLWSGMVFIILAVIGCTMSVSDAINQNISYKPITQIIFFLIFVLLVGLAEEMLFRGVIADSLFRHYGKSPAGVWFSVILSGILFGFVHIINIFSGQSVEQTVIQMISVSMTGMLFAAIYIRHKNIFAPAILHAVLDFFTMFEKGFFENNTIAFNSTDIDFWVSLRQSLMSQSLFLIVAIFILRPRKMKQLIE